MEPVWLTTARRYIGLKEVVGPLHNDTVVNFFSITGNSWVKDDETPWCGAFVGAVFALSGMGNVRPPGEKANALRAREWLNVGAPVELKDAKPGDIIVFSRASGGSSAGHVAFFLSMNGDKVTILGGNQTNSVNISTRNVSTVLGVRRPPVPVSGIADPKPGDVIPVPPPPRPAGIAESATAIIGAPTAAVAWEHFGAGGVVAVVAAVAVVFFIISQVRRK